MTLFVKEVVVSGDAGEENIAGSAVDLTSSDLELAYEGATAVIFGLRFTNVTIPQGATIDDAFLQFQADAVLTDTTVNVTITAHDVDDAPIMTTAVNNITNRLKTTAAVDWDSVPAWENIGDRGAAQKSPDIASVIQEIVDRELWLSGQDIVILVADNGTTNDASREAEPDPENSSDGGPPELTINYTVAGGANPKGVFGMPFHGPLGGPI